MVECVLQFYTALLQEPFLHACLSHPVASSWLRNHSGHSTCTTCINGIEQWTRNNVENDEDKRKRGRELELKEGNGPLPQKSEWPSKAWPAGVGEEGNAGGLEFLQATDLGAVRGTWEENQIRGNRGKRVQRDEKRRMTRYQTLLRTDPR